MRTWRWQGGRPRAVALAWVLGAPALAQEPRPPAPFTLEAIRAYPFAGDPAAAAAAPRLAWPLNVEGRRNVYVAEGPAWALRRLTDFAEDDGQELTSLQLSGDGAWVVFARGGEHGGLWAGPPPNPMSLPVLPRVQVWSVPFAGGAARLLADGDAPVLSPQGDRVAFLRAGQAWVVPVDGSAQAQPLFATATGTVTDLRWSPDGSMVAFTALRGDHSFIGVYGGPARPIRWVAPGTWRDASPRWSPDGARLAWVRRPGAGGPPDPPGDGTAGGMSAEHQPWGIWVADVATGAARRLWQAPRTPRGSPPSTQGGTNLRYAALGRVTYLSYEDGWPHLYSVPDTGGAPLRLTDGRYMVEHAALSADGRTLVFSGNLGPDALDLDRRHVARVPVDRAAVELLTPGAGLEASPVMLADGTVACVSATATRPPMASLCGDARGGGVRVLGEALLPAGFPAAAQLVTPTAVTFRARDGVLVRAQRFEAPGGAARKPAVVFVHGGPQRQMLLGWHPADYYAATYAMNQYLAARGFVVLSVNYRLGIGYGYDFHRPARAGTLGASEVQDVEAAARQLRRDPRVDPARIGIYGGSYGGYLTAQALARLGALFAAGVDLHGVHNFTLDGGSRFGGTAWRYERPAREVERLAALAWRSSPIGALATWRSPILLIHGDDDRNVAFAQTVDLAVRLQRRGVPYEELVIPDDTHRWMRHANGTRVYAAAAAFLERWLGR